MLIARDGHGYEFPVTGIEIRQVGIVRKLFEASNIVRWRDRDLPAVVWIALIVPQPLEKGVSQARLAGG